MEPLARRLIAAKLRASLRQDDDSRQNQDALELLGEVKLSIFQRLTRSSNGAIDSEVRELDAYVRTVASNVFNQYLRQKYPRRLSLKNQLRYLLSHDSRFAIWQTADDRWACGPRSCTSQSDLKVIDLTEAVCDELRLRVKDARGKTRAVIAFVTNYFEIYPEATALDDLVALGCEILNVEEPTEVSESDDIGELRYTATNSTALEVLEDNEFVRRLWKDVLELPLKHRIALLLNFKDDSGESLLSMLPVMRVATIRQVADGLGFGHEELAKIWNELPWDDNRIADRLGITRQQVINLRQSARQMLRRKIWPSS